MHVHADESRGMPWGELAAQAAFVQRIARRLVADHALAEDVAQDALIRALDTRPRSHGAVRSWLRAIVRTVAWNQLRARARRSRREHLAALVHEHAEVLAEDAFERHLANKCVAQAVLTLGEPYRATIRLRY